MRSAQVSRSGLIIVAPIELRISRMDLRTASEESMASVLHEMPAIRDLRCVGQSSCDGLAVSAAAVPRNDGDIGVPGKPGLCRGLLAIWQERYCPTPFKITDDRSVAMVPPPGPVVDANHGQRL
jgi:hypothetical protein